MISKSKKILKKDVYINIVLENIMVSLKYINTYESHQLCYFGKLIIDELELQVKIYYFKIFLNSMNFYFNKEKIISSVYFFNNINFNDFLWDF
jgi:hypothetical protein